MKVFHKDADYAVRSLLFLALRENDEFISATRMAKELGLPLNFCGEFARLSSRRKFLKREKEQAGAFA